jgi:hypothetical protein
MHGVKTRRHARKTAKTRRRDVLGGVSIPRAGLASIAAHERSAVHAGRPKKSFASLRFYWPRR